MTRTRSDRSAGNPGAAPGANFGEARLPARALDPGIGLAVARRTVFRTEDMEDWGRVADRVAAGNMLLSGEFRGTRAAECARLRNAIATGALLTSGRHLQHGDSGQAGNAMELFTTCATAITSFAAFYLLLNGSGVGRATARGRGRDAADLRAATERGLSGTH